jgi:hypothetical protein
MIHEIFIPSVKEVINGEKIVFTPAVIEGEQEVLFSKLTPELANLVLRCIGETPVHIRTRL